MNKESADNVVKCAESSFGFSVLRRSVGTRKTKKNTVLKEEIALFEVVKLTSIVTLDKSNG